MANDGGRDVEQLIHQLQSVFQRGAMPLQELGLSPDQIQALGFQIRDENVVLPSSIERLDASRIRDGLSSRARHWLVELEVLPVAGSTNAMLMDVAARQSPAGFVKLAELQVQGRGRRGRGWLSPFGSSLAMSMGMAVPQRPGDLGGFSLCVGLALVDQLQGLGFEGVELKWPNDVLLNGRKVAGILIELQARPDRTDIVVGIGVNLRLPEPAQALIDQPVAGLEEQNSACSRNLLAATLISGVVDYAEGFAQQGFLPMRDIFNSHHRFHAQHCRLLSGDSDVFGVVQGVTETGELILDTPKGICVFNAGEVSLREAAI